MSLHRDTTTVRKNTIRVHSSGFSFVMRDMFAPLIHHASKGHAIRKIEKTRRATRREIAVLPTSLQQDLAFCDGTVLELERF